MKDILQENSFRQRNDLEIASFRIFPLQFLQLLRKDLITLVSKTLKYSIHIMFTSL